MPRTLSQNALISMMSQRTTEVWIELVTIRDGTNVLARWAKNTETVTSRGVDYTPSWWELQLPDSDPERLPTVQFAFPNVHRDLVASVRELSNPLEVTHEVVLASTPDVVEVGPFVYTLKDIRYNATVLEGTLGFEDLLHEQFPKDKFIPTYFPGLF